MEMMPPSRIKIIGCRNQVLKGYRFSIANFGLNARFELQVEVITSALFYDKNFKSAILKIECGEKTMSYSGDLLTARSCLLNQTQHHLYLTFGCVLHRLDNESHQRCFVHQSAEDIIQTLLVCHGVDAVFQWQQSKKTLPYVTQGGVSDYDFLLRLCDEYGIIFYYRPSSDGSLVLHFTDGLPDAAKEQVFIFQPDNGMLKDKNSIGSVRHFSALLPQKIRLRGAKIDAPETKFLAMTENQTTMPGAGLLNINQVYAFQSQEDCDKAACLMQQQLDWQRQWLLIETDVAGIYPGMLIQLTHHPEQQLNRLYRVLNINSRSDETPNGAKVQPFHSQMVLILVEHPYKMPNQYTRMRWSENIHGNAPESWQRAYDKPTPGLQIAKIMKRPNHLTLDKEGHYNVQPYFYPTQQNVRPAIFSAHQMQVNAGPARQGSQGMHFVVPEETRVIVADSSHLANVALILGVLPDRIQKSPVTSENENQLVMRHPCGSALLFDDHANLQKIQWHTEQHRHGLLFEKDQQRMQVSIYSLGTMVFNGGKALTLKSGQNCVFTQQELHFLSQQAMTIVAEKEILWQAEQDVHVSCGNDWLLYSQSQSVLIDAQSQCTLQAKQHLFNASSLCFASHYFEILTADTWVACANKGIEMRSSASGLLLSKQSIAFTAPHIKIMASQLLCCVT